MKNILNESSEVGLNARLDFSIKLVSDKDIKNKRVLDIGCGFGWFELSALNKGVKEIVGIEISANDLKAARKSIKDKRAKFTVAGALKLPFEDNYFDTIVSWEVIEHIPKNMESIMFKEVDRVLKKNGTFYLSTPYNSWQSRFFDPAWWILGHRHYSKKKLDDLGKSVGFKDSKIYVKGRYWSLISLLNMYTSKWILKRRPLFSRYFDKKEKQEYKSNEGFMGIFVRYEKE